VTLTFEPLTLKLVRAAWAITYQFCYFLSRLKDQQLPVGQRDIVTMTFDFEGHCAARGAALHATSVYTKFEVRNLPIQQ